MLIVEILVVGLVTFAVAKLSNATLFKHRSVPAWAAFLLAICMLFPGFIACLLLRILHYEARGQPFRVPTMGGPLVGAIIFYCVLNKRTTLRSTGTTTVTPPREHNQELKVQIETDRATTSGTPVNGTSADSSPASPGPSGDAVSRLQQFKKLREGGLISEDEYEEKRKSIIDKI
jgi:hypothetical protein